MPPVIADNVTVRPCSLAIMTIDSKFLNEVSLNESAAAANVQIERVGGSSLQVLARELLSGNLHSVIADRQRCRWYASLCMLTGLLKRRPDRKNSYRVEAVDL